MEPAIPMQREAAADPLMVAVPDLTSWMRLVSERIHVLECERTELRAALALEEVSAIQKQVERLERQLEQKAEANDISGLHQKLQQLQQLQATPASHEDPLTEVMRVQQKLQQHVQHVMNTLEMKADGGGLRALQQLVQQKVVDMDEQLAKCRQTADAVRNGDKEVSAIQKQVERLERQLEQKAEADDISGLHQKLQQLQQLQATPASHEAELLKVRQVQQELQQQLTNMRETKGQEWIAFGQLVEELANRVDKAEMDESIEGVWPALDDQVHVVDLVNDDDDDDDNDDDDDDDDERPAKRKRTEEPAFTVDTMSEERFELVGRHEELQRTIEILCRRDKNNPVLVGEAGVGKTSIALGLAQLIAEGKVPLNLKDTRVVKLDLSLLLEGTGAFEAVVKEITNNNEHIILVVDEVHMLLGAGSGGSDTGGGMGSANLLKSALAAGKLQCIGLTTLEQWKCMESQPALERHFQPVNVPEPTEEESVQILKSLAPKYEQHHQLRYTTEALEACVKLSGRFIADRYLPGKAIDVMDEAGSKVCQQLFQLGEETEKAVTAEDVAQVVSSRTGIAVGQVTADESSRLLHLEEELRKSIIGQDEAVHSICNALLRARVGLRNPQRPIAGFLFCGSTGVGKTALCKTLATTFFGTEETMIRLDMSEFREEHSVSKLIGAPPGYVGYSDGGALTEAVLRRPHSIVLFDEVEKAHRSVHNLLLQLLDDGRLTDSKGRVVSFSNTMVVMTSNLGSTSVQKARAGGLGLGSGVGKELKAHFAPELLNRLDEVIAFQPLREDDLRAIAEVEYQKVLARLADKDLEVELCSSFKEQVIKQGYDPAYGARPLRRAITNMLEDTLAKYLLERASASDKGKTRIRLSSSESGKAHLTVLEDATAQS